MSEDIIHVCWLEAKSAGDGAITTWYPHLTEQSLLASMDETTTVVDEYAFDGAWLTIYADGTWLHDLPEGVTV